MIQHRPWHQSARRRPRGWCRLTGIALLVLLAVACGAPGPGDAADRLASASEATFLNQAPDVAYVGMEACRDCHLGVYSTYTDTGMGRAFEPMSDRAALADWSGQSAFVDPGSGLHYRMTERDGRYYQRQFRVAGDGSEIAVDERQLVFVVGSNNHNRSYLVEIDGKLFQAPVCWYPQASRWDLCPGYEHRNDHFSREVTPNCIFCHNGVMQPAAGERNRYEEPIPHGIGCERCHGPGALHVEKWSRRGAEASGEPDPTIVHPRRLPVERRIDLCLQCHLGDAKATERLQRSGASLYDYRPGRPLSDIVVPFRFRLPTEVDFGLSAQADRLMLSRCYTESRGRLECQTCHNPHVTVYHDERPPEMFRRRCLGCHAPDDCGAEPGERQRTADVADDCIACHMRRAEPDDQRFTEFTDHWIRKELPGDDRDARPSHAIEPALPEQMVGFSAGERSFYRARASFLLGEEAEPVVRDRLWQEAIGAFREAIDEGHDTAETRYQLGKVHLHRGGWREAAAEFARALEREPDHHGARFALGQALGSAGDLPGALREFGLLVEADGDDPMALAEYARAAWTIGRTSDALAAYRRARELEPWNDLLHHNEAATLASLGRFEEAYGPSAESLRLNPDDGERWAFHARLLAELGRTEESAEASRIASGLGAPEVR